MNEIIHREFQIQYYLEKYVKHFSKMVYVESCEWYWYTYWISSKNFWLDFIFRPQIIEMNANVHEKYIFRNQTVT